MAIAKHQKEFLQEGININDLKLNYNLFRKVSSYKNVDTVKLWEEDWSKGRHDIYIILDSDSYNDDLYVLRASVKLDESKTGTTRTGKKFISFPVIDLENLTAKLNEKPKIITTREDDGITDCFVENLSARDLYAIIHNVPCARQDFINILVEKYKK